MRTAKKAALCFFAAYWLMNISLCSGILSNRDHSSQRFGSQDREDRVRRGIRASQIVSVTLAGAALLIAIATIVIGTWPYERPSIALETRR